MPCVSHRRFSRSLWCLGGLAHGSGAALGWFRLFGQERRPNFKPIVPSRPLRSGFQARGDVLSRSFLV